MTTWLNTKRSILMALAITASIGGAASAFAGDVATEGKQQSSLDDPSYRSYLRWNGFDEADNSPARDIPAPSYDSYLEWNGFTVNKPTTGPDIPAPSYTSYLRWNGFDIDVNPPVGQARSSEPANGRSPRS